jgi:molybdopterin molybdotransferase
MLSLELALEQLLAAVQPVGSERLPLSEILGRYIAEPIDAPNPLPLFDNSAMDGYAVRAADGSRQSAVLTQIARIPAGEFFEGEIKSGQCARIFTGSPMPAGADAVVMQEDTRVEGDRITILDPVKPWENVRFRGEDVKQGALIANRGEKITASLLGLLGACGVGEASVHRQVRVAILATGSELRSPGAIHEPGEIFESNRLMIAALAREGGLVPEIKEVVPDDHGRTVAALREAAGADAVITCGGVSVGEFDFVKSAVQELGGAIDFWRVAIKPGKPFVHATVLGKPMFGLPGNPVSALVTFLLLARPALLRMSGAADVEPGRCLGELAEEISNPGDRRHFVRVIMDANGLVRASGPQASHRLGSLAAANGLLDVPAGAQWETGRRVAVLRF